MNEQKLSELRHQQEQARRRLTEISDEDAELVTEMAQTEATIALLKVSGKAWVEHGHTLTSLQTKKRKLATERDRLHSHISGLELAISQAKQQLERDRLEQQAATKKRLRQFGETLPALKSEAEKAVGLWLAAVASVEGRSPTAYKLADAVSHWNTGLEQQAMHYASVAYSNIAQGGQP